MLVPGLGHGAGAQQVVGRQHARRRTGIDQFARQQERVGEVAPYLVEIMQHHHHRALLGAPALDQHHQVGDGLGIDGGKRLVQQDEVGVLQKHAGEQHALELADRERVDRPALEARKPDRLDGVLCVVEVDRLGGAEAAEARPAAEQHRVEHGDREGAVDLGLLRQVGDAPGRAFDAAFDVRRQPEQRLQERALARAVGPDDGRHLRRRDLGRHVMHGRMAVVAHGQIDQTERRRHSAHQAASHNSAARPSAAAMRADALMASSVVPGETRVFIDDLL